MTGRNDAPSAVLELAAAGLAVEAVATMNRAREVAGVSQVELARRVGVGESRISALLNGDGNVRMATLGRVLRALGYQVRLQVEPVDADSPVIPRRQRSVPRRRVSRLPESERVWCATVSVNLPDTVPQAWTHMEVSYRAR